jgi:hypothetical protein
MADEKFKEILDTFDEQFSENIHDINNEIHWIIPLLGPASFIMLHKKTFIGDPHFFDLPKKTSQLKLKEVLEKLLEERLDLKINQKFESLMGLCYALDFYMDWNNSYMMQINI